MEEDNEFCEKHCKGYRDTGGRCFADGRCDAYWEYQKQKGTMTKEEKIREICQDSIGKLGGALSETIAHAISEGYKLGWEECAKQLGVKL